MNFKVEQCRLMNGLNYVSNFSGKGKINIAEIYVELEIISINPAKLKLTCSNNGVWGTSIVDLINADTIGVLPHIEIKRLMKVLKTVPTTTELKFETIENISKDNIANTFCTLDFVGRVKPITFLQDQSILFTAPKLDNPSIYNVEGAIIKNGVKCVNSIVKRNEQNMIYNCVCLTLTPGAVLFEGVDLLSHSFVNSIYASKNQQSVRTFFDVQKAAIGIVSFDESLPVKISLTNNFIAFEQSNLYAYIQLYVGAFLNTTSYMPKQYKYKYSFSKLDMMNCLERIDALIPPSSTIRTCEVEFSAMGTIITSISVSGSNIEKCSSTSQTLDKIKKVFNLDNFIKILKQMPNGLVDAIIYENGFVNLQHSSKTDIIKCLVSPLTQEIKQVSDKKKNKKGEEEVA